VRSLGLTPEVPPGMVYIEAHPDLWTRAETAYTRWSGEPVIGACGETSNGGATTAPDNTLPGADAPCSRQR